MLSEAFSTLLFKMFFFIFTARQGARARSHAAETHRQTTLVLLGTAKRDVGLHGSEDGGTDTRAEGDRLEQLDRTTAATGPVRFFTRGREVTNDTARDRFHLHVHLESLRSNHERW